MAINEFISQLQIYHTNALRQANRPIIYYLTKNEMDFLKKEAGDNPVRLELLEKHYRVYEFMEEEPYDYQKG